MQARITDYSVEWSFDHSQYWPGAGTYGTPYENCYTGTGATPRDGWEDVCDQIAMSGFDTTDIVFPDEAALDLPLQCECDESDADEDNDYCEHSYFVTVRFNAEDNEQFESYVKQLVHIAAVAEEEIDIDELDTRKE